ncbi:MAG: hypothetical protein KJO98_09090 [Rhodothermia bacterium]|nr:hypothetical protein [Rhodothermia bacterium]
MARIVVCGYMVRHPVAGNMLAYAQYVLGLRLLGHIVTYVEESGWPNSCFDPITMRHTDDASVGFRLAKSLYRRLGIDAPVLYIDRDSRATFGGTEQNVLDVLDDADLLVNVGGVCWLPEFEKVRRKILIDMDPMFTQLGMFSMEGNDCYDAYFSYGTNIGQPGCQIPVGSIRWLPTTPPVVPSLWQSTDSSSPREKNGTAVFSTIANWNAYGGVVHDGEHFGQKDEEFLAHLTLPSRVSARLEIAVAGAPASVIRKLKVAGWSVSDALEVSGDVNKYKEYITSSIGEFSVAKNGYVKSRSGWFSDRSACYLAAGRPVVLQDTGYSQWIACGEGLIPFSDLDGAAEAIENVCGDYDRNSQAAREVAKSHFDYKTVLESLLARAQMN